MKYILYALLLLLSGANAADLWREGKTYNVGDIVIFNEKYYEAIQTHTAHINANWTPASTPVLWKEIARGENDPNECYDAATGGYISPCPEDSTHNLLYVNFDNHHTGPYSSTDFKHDWHISPPNSSGLSAGRLSIVRDPAGIENKVLRVTYSAGQTGGNSAMVFNVPLSNKDNTLWFQYRVMFDPGFIWVKGGKLPGLAGSDKPTGCIDNGTFDGFSARLMWRENGAVYGYFYYPDKSEKCGDYFRQISCSHPETGTPLLKK